MKQCIKYCMVLILAALMHADAMEAATLFCAPPQEHAELTQAPAPRQTVHNIYYILSFATSCLEHVDTSQVPVSKSVLLPVYFLRLQQSLRAQDCSHLPRLFSPPSPSPTYYVFGLRKIIV